MEYMKLAKPKCPYCGTEMSPDFSDIYTTFPPKRPCSQCDWICVLCGYRKLWNTSQQLSK